jgi:RHS repeat-associated protein
MFTGREYYPHLWLYDFRNRWYDAQLGRFLQPDPTGFDAGDMNLFRYCGDDPVDKTDPMGLVSVPSMRFYDQPLFPPDWSRLQRLGFTMGYWAFSDKKLEADFKKAEQAQKDPVIKAMFARIAADKVHRVMIIRSNSVGRNSDQFTGYANGNASFAWNPRAASAFSGGTQSPATVLVHEAAHADRFLSDPGGIGRDFHAGDGAMGHVGRFGNLEEKRVITGPEARAAAALGENTRDSAASVFYPVDSVLGR